VLYGTLLPDGPTLLTSNVFGSGSDKAMTMLDVTGTVVSDGLQGVVTAHKTDQGKLNLLFWKYHDSLKTDYEMPPTTICSSPPCYFQ
jgi:hypothetical protein